ncbi:aminotransferase class I/II-fold pyridoxal phosphate-dependent enzyme [Maribacter antarcticus]|uniref:aminotransferase class I/II-fold pyridoxal phosphate-dependent enzyme n=1 Tax=Maribacter antarcticus TaxID=505250 RepID=UPI00047A4729|nr:8-amino-7-oxononanoate synthase [Maribacter antarcticus]
MQKLPTNLQQKIAKRTKEKALRSLEKTAGLIDFSSNDYLGFAHNETLFSKTFQLLLTENIAQNGATGSRLISGNHKLYLQLEQLLVDFHETESALVFNSGYDANIGFFGAVPQRDDIVFYDEHIHASIRDGIKIGNAKSYKFKHNDVEDLESRCKTEQDRSATQAVIYVVTESVFSMDGDTPDLKALAAFCTKKGYCLVVDEAHALGVMGPKGQGVVQQLGLQNEIFARIITFGKAMGCHGAAILGASALKEYLINFARSFVYTTGLTPHTVATIISAYGYLQNEGTSEIRRLQENLVFFKEKYSALGLEKHFIPSSSAIQSCILKGNARVLKISKTLLDKGFYVKAIRSPTVPEGKERLRFCLHSTKGKEEIGLVLELLSKYL